MDEERTLGSLIIESVEEHLAYMRGKGPGRSVVVDVPALLTARDVTVAPPPACDAKRIRAARLNLMLSQHVFAQVLNVSSDTVKAWEQGVREPSGAALRLLQIAELRPDVLRDFVHVHDGHAQEEPYVPDNRHNRKRNLARH